MDLKLWIFNKWPFSLAQGEWTVFRLSTPLRFILGIFAPHIFSHLFTHDTLYWNHTISFTIYIIFTRVLPTLRLGFGESPLHFSILYCFSLLFSSLIITHLWIIYVRLWNFIIVYSTPQIINLCQTTFYSCFITSHFTYNDYYPITTIFLYSYKNTC